jgi:radical SAM superfamily enzyme YgiQ (UPF0313 family)
VEKMELLKQTRQYSKAAVCLLGTSARTQSRRPPLALMSLAAYLEIKGISTEIIDIKTTNFMAVNELEEKEINKITLAAIKKIDPMLIGITAYCHEINETIRLAKLIKQKFPKKTIVVGGIQGTLFPESFLFKGSPIDIVVIGEGEVTLTELAEKIKENKSIKNVLGIATLNKNRIVKTGWRPLIDNLDDIPQPAFEKVDMEFYLKPNIYGIRWLPLSCFYIFTSRGCPGMCTFCVNKNLWKAFGYTKMIRFKSIKKVVDEIEILMHKYKMDALYVYDDSFIISRQRAIDFCEELKKRKLKLVWGCEARVDRIDEEIVKVMKKAGCVQIDFGVESGSQRCLNTVKKNISIAQIENAFRICHKYKMRTNASMMFNFPNETEEEVKQTWALAERIHSTNYTFSILTPYPGTDIYAGLNLKLTRKQHDLFKSAYIWLMNKKFRLASHSLDLNKLAVDATLHFNSVFRYASPQVAKVYLHVLIHSKRKRQYLETGWELALFTAKHLLPRILKRNLTVNQKKQKIGKSTNDGGYANK